MIYIHNQPWDIRIVPPNSTMLMTSSGDLTLGVCDDNYKTIFISSGLSPSKLKKVLCHEITHAAMFSYGVSMSIEQEEVVADLIATFGKEIIDVTDQLFKRMT